MGCFMTRPGNNAEDQRGEVEQAPILNSYHGTFRTARDKHTQTRGEKFALCSLKFAFCTAGYWLPSNCCFLYVVWLLMLSSFQLVYDLFTVFHCPNFDCRFLIDNATQKNPSRTAQNAAYTLASIGGLFSYVFMIVTLYLTHKKRNALGPKSILLDVTKKHLCILLSLVCVLFSCWASTVTIFYYLVRNQISLSSKSIILVAGVGSQLATQWNGIVACFVFGAVSLAISEY